MKALLTLCLLVIAAFSAANAQPRGNRDVRLTRAQIKEAEQRLADLGYWTGTVDGVVDAGSRSALIAFQKWEGRPVTAKLTLAELEAIRAAEGPKAREPGYEHIEVDLDRQVLLIINEEGGVRVLPVSTGSGKPFVVDGQTSIAYTPRGRFVVYDKTYGWKTAYSVRSTTQITSPAALRFTGTKPSLRHPRVTAASAFRCSPHAR